MANSKQCELARFMTQDITPDICINEQLKTLDASSRCIIVKKIDKLLKEHDMPFDKGFSVMINDFSKISAEFSISPATLFCLYMEEIGKS